MDVTEITNQLQPLVRVFENDALTSEAAVRLQYPVWRTTFLPLAVLFEAWSRTTGMPTVFYIDSFAALLLGLINKDITVDVAGFPCQSRYWAVGTAQPGSGKSPAVDPMVECMRKVLRANHDLAAGKPWDTFHIFKPMTHCAAIDKLKTTDGYATIVAGEGGPLLCPSWPTSGTWNQATHINLARFLDGANGGAVPWQTAIDRKQRKDEAEGEIHALEDPAMDRTNITLLLLQQRSVLKNWWVTSEVKNKIGLPQRCLFSFGAAREPGPPAMQTFESRVVMPILERLFTLALKSLGPKAPQAAQHRFTLQPSDRHAFWRYRLTCKDVNKKTHFGETFAAGLNKESYWVSTFCLFGTLLEHLWPPACAGSLGCFRSFGPCI